MKAGLRRWMVWIGYPLAYLMLLVLFARCTFPYSQLKERIVAEFDRSQASSRMTLTIGELDGYWFSGLEAKDVVLSHAPSQSKLGAARSQDAPSKPEVTKLDSAHAEVSLLKALFGTTAISFGVEVDQGVAKGEVVSSEVEQSIELELEQLSLTSVPMLAALVGMPIKGVVAGSVVLTLPERKVTKAEGLLKVELSNVKVGDGKSKILNTIALPEMDVGAVQLGATVTEGKLKIESMTVKGKDIDLHMDGSIRLRDPVGMSALDLSLRFKFNDSYRSKNDLAKGLFGAPGSPIPGAFEMNDKVKRSKTVDGYYGWRIMGSLDHPIAEPSATAGAGERAGSRPSKSSKRTNRRARH